MNLSYDIVVIGGGPAGLAAAYSAWENGARNILILERDQELGGILNQCIHNGFGLHYFKEELTGPEYAGRFIELLQKTGVEVKLDTMVLHVTPEKQVHAINPKDGYMIIDAKAVILAMGCRERTRGAIGIPGDRPSGVFTAGTAQRYVNIEGKQCGKRVVILGSGDIGLIMARRLTLEGAKVLACVELMPYSNGLTREAGIEIDPRTNGAVVYENRETSLPGVFACGNVLHVHDLVDFVSGESEKAGKAAAEHLLGKRADGAVLNVTNGEGVSYTVPQKIRPNHLEKTAELYFRVRSVYRGGEILVTRGEEIIARFSRERMAPGEMERILLPAQKLLAPGADELCVSVKGGEPA